MANGLRPNQRYKVVDQRGVQYSGYLAEDCSGATPGKYVLYRRLTRRLTPQGGHEGTYKELKPPRSAWTWQYDQLVAVVYFPVSIVPAGAPTAAARVPWSAFRDGSWWKDIRVEYIALDGAGS